MGALLSDDAMQAAVTYRPGRRDLRFAIPPCHDAFV